jgi:hypothetical protein
MQNQQRIGPSGKSLGPLSRWSRVRFLTPVYGENSVWIGELTLCVPLIARRSSLTEVKTSYLYYGNPKKCRFFIPEDDVDDDP